MKKYLNSVEEVVKALKEGKKVTYFNDGFLIEDQQDEGTVINSHIYFNEKYKYYTEEAEPLKFEVNRAYKTRGGNKVFLFKIQENNADRLYFVGAGALHFWTDKNGRVTENENYQDVVGYWEEEK